MVNVPKQSEHEQHELHADCLGLLEITTDGHKHILINAFTKYSLLLLLKSVKADETRSAFQLFILSFGTLKQIILDAGRNFNNVSHPEYWDFIHVCYTMPNVHRKLYRQQLQ